MIHVKVFSVQGQGKFPMEMLAWDKCFPDTMHDAANIGDWERDGKRTVHLNRISGKPNWAPSRGQWEFHGWKVIYP